MDVEFAVSITPGKDKPNFTFHLLQCRPQNQWNVESREIQSMPTDLAAQDKILLCTRMVPQGRVSQIEYILHVDLKCLLPIGFSEEHSEVAVVSDS